MGWLERQFGCQQSSSTTQQAEAIAEEMSPGLDGDYDHELREKAGMHVPPPPPEFMGLEGEYDTNGLAKRVALAFDRNPALADLDTLEVAQEGSTIVFRGSLPDESLLEELTQIAAKVDGTKAIDSHQVTIKMA